MCGTYPFQSQTGSQALSDQQYPDLTPTDNLCFNPKREARPSQTAEVQAAMEQLIRFNPKREARPSQTTIAAFYGVQQEESFNPKREARPSQTHLLMR